MTVATRSDFSLERLERLLGQPGAVIRHDVDYDLECALRMAEFEEERGVTATYYIRPCGDAYNPFSLWGQQVVWAICQLGHRIGTHVDSGLGRGEEVSDFDLTRICHEQRRVLAAMFSVGHAVSFHQPPGDVLGRKIRGFTSAHEEFWQQRYASDSRGVFRIEPESLRGGPHQLVLHPCWWFLPEGEADALRAREAGQP